MSKKTWLLGLWLVVALSTTVPVKAGQFDFVLLGGRYSVDVEVDVADFPAVVLIKAQENRATVPLDGDGGMTAVGDFEQEETRRSYSEVALGYKFGPVTPFVGYSTRAIFLEERSVIKNGLTGKNQIVTKHDKESMSGLVFGLNFAQRLGRVGVGATIAKAANGIYGEAKVKYYINDHLALLGGGIYHPGVNATGLVVGLGISY